MRSTCQKQQCVSGCRSIGANWSRIIIPSGMAPGAKQHQNSAFCIGTRNVTGDCFHTIQLPTLQGFAWPQEPSPIRPYQHLWMWSKTWRTSR
eukprot:11592859-Ditylum_brightwellii.AAC.1